MPKRKKSDKEKIFKYQSKIRRLQERSRHRRSRSVSTVNSDDSGSGKYTDFDETHKERREEHSDSDKDNEIIATEEVNEVNLQLNPEPSSENISAEANTNDSALDLETLQALGDPILKKPKYGDNINLDLAKRCENILMNGLNKEAKELLLQEYLIPGNCMTLQAPKLNPEIIATISDNIKNRDKKIESEQQQLGQGITALNKALSLLVTNTGERLSIIKTLSDASKILTDLHCCHTISRRKLITPVLDKKFLEIIKEVERDEYLYGENLSEKIKAMKNAQKSGQSIKKTDGFKAPINKKVANFSGSGNFRGPPRYQTPKPYIRSGHKRPPAERNPPYKQFHHSTRKTKVEMKPPAQK